MNITEYRAMVEAEKATQSEGTVPNAQTEQSATDAVQPGVQETPQIESTPTNEGAQTEAPSAPQLFDVGGQQVSLEELQRGYLRQSDYTRKTQDIARQQRELQRFEELKEQFEANPELAEQVGFDPQEVSRQELEQNYYDLLVQQEINELSTKYADFDAQSVLEFASQNEMDNLEHAYLLHKQLVPQQPNITPATPVQSNEPIDVEALKAQLRAELQAEMNTSTIISASGTAPQPQSEVVLTPQEAKIASAFKMTPEQYKRWSN